MESASGNYTGPSPLTTYDQGRADQASGTVDTSRTADREYVRGLGDERTAQVDRQLIEIYGPEVTYSPSDLLRLADQCDQGAAELDGEAARAAEILAERSGQVDPEVWADRKRDAAAAARQYAADLRAEVGHLDQGATVTAERYAQADAVARAAALGGILIDGSKLNQAGLVDPWNSEATREAIRDGMARKVEAVIRSGAFAHVAEPGQVPYWRLTTEPDPVPDLLARVVPIDGEPYWQIVTD